MLPGAPSLNIFRPPLCNAVPPGKPTSIILNNKPPGLGSLNVGAHEGQYPYPSAERFNPGLSAGVFYPNCIRMLLGQVPWVNFGAIHIPLKPFKYAPAASPKALGEEISEKRCKWLL